MTWLPYDTWIVVIGGLCAVACALPGCFLFLRGLSMMGDAISHAVLPGLAIAFLITGSRASVEMFIGAAVVGILTAVFTQWISSWGKVDRGASMGIVFTTLFALGLLLIVQAADHVDLDPGCVLYGAIELTPLDKLNLFGALEMPRAALVLLGVLLLNLLAIIFFFKEFRISAFDPELATSLGINAQAMHYLLMTLVAVTTVASFEVVGSVIVIAMLIVPAATAHLLTDRLHLMLWISAALAAVAAVMGHLFAILLPPLIEPLILPGNAVANANLDTTTSGMIAVASGLFFFAAWLFAPRHGILLKRRQALAEPMNDTA